MEPISRPSRSQRTLLDFIEQFVRQHGYGPSYREIMRGLDYKSVSTVAIHVNGLIAKGQLKKSGRSARSLEVVKQPSAQTVVLQAPASDPDVWLAAKLREYAGSPDADLNTIKAAQPLLKVLGLKQTDKQAAAALEEKSPAG